MGSRSALTTDHAHPQYAVNSRLRCSPPPCALTSMLRLLLMLRAAPSTAGWFRRLVQHVHSPQHTVQHLCGEGEGGGEGGREGGRDKHIVAGCGITDSAAGAPTGKLGEYQHARSRLKHCYQPPPPMPAGVLAYQPPHLVGLPLWIHMCIGHPNTAHACLK